MGMLVPQAHATVVVRGLGDGQLQAVLTKGSAHVGVCNIVDQYLVALRSKCNQQLGGQIPIVNGHDDPCRHRQTPILSSLNLTESIARWAGSDQGKPPDLGTYAARSALYWVMPDSDLERLAEDAWTRWPMKTEAAG